MNTVVDHRYGVVNSDPKLDFFAISVSAKDIHSRALSVYFSALIDALCDINTPLKEDGIFAISKELYLFGQQMVGEYLFYAVGKEKNVEALADEIIGFIYGKGSDLEKMGKSFDKMSAKVPHIASYASPVYALYKFVWEKLLHIVPSDDVDVMYLNKIMLLMQRIDTVMMFTSLEKYKSVLEDRPVLVIGDIPEHYEFVDKLVKDVSYSAKLFLHPLRGVGDVIYGYLAKIWYLSKGYGVIFERIRDYLLMYVYGKGQIPHLPVEYALSGKKLLWREAVVDPIRRIEILNLVGHVIDGEWEESEITPWEDVIETTFTIKGRT